MSCFNIPNACRISARLSAWLRCIGTRSCSSCTWVSRYLDKLSDHQHEIVQDISVRHTAKLFGGNKWSKGFSYCRFCSTFAYKNHRNQ